MDANDDAAEAFGAFLLAQRKLANISQRQLAKMSGVSDSYLSQVERGKYRPSAEVLHSLAGAFGLPSSQLYAQFGLLDDDGPDETPAASVEVAIQRDERLTAEQKAALLSVYRLFAE